MNMPERHIQADFRDKIKWLNNGTIKYVPKEEKEIDWKAYTLAQVNEINDYLVLTKKMVDAARLRVGYMKGWKSPGRPPKSPYDKAKALLLQAYFEVSNNVAEGLVRLFREKVGISEDITSKDIERAYDSEDVKLVLQTVFEMTNEPIQDKEHNFSIDGSGMPASIKQNYANDRAAGEEKKMACYEKFVGVIGTTYKMFSAFDIGDGTDNECPYLIPLVKETYGAFQRIDLVCGDAAYLSRENCSYIASIGAVPRIYPKENATINADGSMPWRKMLVSFTTDTQGWLRAFHERSISESGNSILKRNYSRPLQKRIRQRRKREAYAKICSYNIRMLCYNCYLRDVRMPFLSGC